MIGYMRIIVLLVCSSFCLGVAEFIVSGILPQLSQFFQVSIDEVGYMATLYALGVVIGAPIVSVLIASWNYRIQLTFTMLVFALANAVIFFVDDFFIVLFARFVCGLMHGLFFVIATIVVIKIAPKEKASSALSLMVSGLTIALVTGIPLGIFLSQQYGLLSPFAFIAIVSFCVGILASLIMPNMEGRSASFRNLLHAFAFPPLYQGFLITAFTCGSQFVVYIYLRVFLEQYNFSAQLIAQIFLYYGIAAVVGNLFGGKLTDLKGSFFALQVILLMQIIFFACMSITYMLGVYFVIVNILGVAFFGFASIAPLKMLSTYLARTYTPKTQNDTIALNEASFNVGIAFASFVGGTVQYIIGVHFNGLFAALFSFCALLILVLYIRIAYCT